MIKDLSCGSVIFRNNYIEEVKKKAKECNCKEVQLFKTLCTCKTKESLGNLEVLIIESNHKKSAYWGFPKGHKEKGETDIETAIREVKEEVNIDIDILDEKDIKSNYIIVDKDKKVYKEVRYFIANYINGIIKIQESELNNAIWIDVNKALERLTYEQDKEVLKKAIEKYKAV